MSIRLKRAYDKPSRSDGVRILVDRLWPRGLTKDQVHVKEWLKDAAPSTQLRQWFKHDPDNWPDFRKQYIHELQQHPDVLEPVRQQARRHTVTLIYSAKDEQHNNAVVIKELLENEVGDDAD
jgi:uncharacterized protein YeaO (DUF488 family)